MSKSGFRDLDIWIEAKSLAVEIYKLTSEKKFLGDFGFRDQIRRAAVSIPSNIAEGDERGSNRDSVRFFYISKGSLAELITQLDIALEIGYISAEEHTNLLRRSEVLGKKIGALIKVRSNTP